MMAIVRMETRLADLNSAFTAMRQGVATEAHWDVMSDSLKASRAMEQQRTAPGLFGHATAAAEALQAIHSRARKSDRWYPPELHLYELDAVQTFVDLYAYQLRLQRNQGRQRFVTIGHCMGVSA